MDAGPLRVVEQSGLVDLQRLQGHCGRNRDGRCLERAVVVALELGEPRLEMNWKLSLKRFDVVTSKAFSMRFGLGAGAVCSPS